MRMFLPYAYRTCFTCLFLLSIEGTSAISQGKRAYTSFVNDDTTIKWAAEYSTFVNLTPARSGTNLKKWYNEKLRTKGITAYLFDNARQVQRILVLKNPLVAEEWLKGFYPVASDDPRQWAFRQAASSGNYFLPEPSLYTDDSCCGCDASNAFRVNQVLFYRAGKLEVNNIFLSPLCARRVKNDRFQWYSLGNVALNDNIQKKPASAIYLATSTVRYPIALDDGARDISILTAGNAELISFLLKDIYAEKVHAYDPITNQHISQKEFLEWRTASDTTLAQAENGQYRTVVLKKQLASGDLSELSVNQAWFFDFKSEKIYSEIISVQLMKNVYTPDGSLLGKAPYARLLFRK